MPGFCFSTVTASDRFRAGKLWFASSTTTFSATMPTGAKSLTGSYGMVGYKALLMPWVLVVPISKV
ncbi:hypothetical protein D3C86_1653960 [compost metagenome]